MAEDRLPAKTATIAPHPRLAELRRFADARIGLGRAGAAMPTAAHLRFTLDHARARDAVYSALDPEPLRQLAQEQGLPLAEVRSQAQDRAVYVRRPDLGRRLDPTGADALALLPTGKDVVLVVADGLSATAVNQNAAALLHRLIPTLRDQRRSLAGLVIASQARVALGDPIALALGARIVLLLIGERPGLSAADSLGAYLTFEATPGTPDSRRNCVSNIRTGGLDPATAAARLAWLVNTMHEARTSGVTLPTSTTPLLG
ncbi:MAG: ethanolamine ammonia-lyase subunit EutC [Geminicoccaceae bacterium]|nr:MAG: ethanolamine ammonia-lyase subunit EutC [Geminicoccaceae bacterium]